MFVFHVFLVCNVLCLAFVFFNFCKCVFVIKYCLLSINFNMPKCKLAKCIALNLLLQSKSCFWDILSFCRPISHSMFTVSPQLWRASVDSNTYTTLYSTRGCFSCAIVKFLYSSYKWNIYKSSFAINHITNTMQNYITIYTDSIKHVRHFTK